MVGTIFRSSVEVTTVARDMRVCTYGLLAKARCLMRYKYSIEDFSNLLFPDLDLKLGRFEALKGLALFILAVTVPLLVLFFFLSFTLCRWNPGVHNG